MKCLMAILLFSVAALADEPVVVKSTGLGPAVYMLEGDGGNMTASIGPDGTFLVDDDFAETAPALLAKLRELKGDMPRFIVNTHFHYDHSGGNEVFGPTATIIAATAARDRLTKEQTLWGKQHPPMARQGWPTLTFDDSLVLHLNGDDVRIHHLPHGHTDGDVVVLFEKSKVASLGDLYFSGMYPIFHPEHEGDLAGYVRDLAWALERIPDDAKIVPGHGPLSDKSQLRRYYAMIVASIATVKDGIAHGLSLEQIQKKGLAPEWESFSHGYRNTDQWLASIYMVGLRHEPEPGEESDGVRRARKTNSRAR